MQGWRALPFGGHLEGERTFGGLTVPTRVRGGWWFGDDRYDDEGEFFRAEVQDLHVDSSWTMGRPAVGSGALPPSS